MNWCLLDIDGVVLDWERGLAEYMEANTPHLHPPQYFDPHAYDIASRYGISRDEANNIVWNFHYDQSFANLHIMPGAKEAIDLLAKKYKIAAITACGTDAAIVTARNINLNSLFPNVFTAIHCVDMWHEKRQYLSAYSAGIWVEDHLRNCQMGLEFGHECYLIDAPYNQNATTTNVHRVGSLLDVARSACI